KQIKPFTSLQKGKEPEQKPKPQDIINQQAQQILLFRKENE
ncbi:23293_t:CDS:1, partial [Racocetra persica]